MEKKLFILGMLLSIPTYIMFSSPFTLKKEKKEDVISEEQKQKYAQTCGEILQEFPKLLHVLADIHTKATQCIQAFVENDVSFCAKTSKGDFEQCLAKAEHVNKQLKQVQQELQGFIQTTQKLP